MRRIGAAVCASAVAIASCSVEEATPLPRCADGDAILLVAQSVPSASQVPCLSDVPTSWTATRVIVNQDGTIIRFESAADDRAAELRLQFECDVGGVARTATRPGVDRYDGPTGRDYLFDGGCVSWQFDAASGAERATSAALADALRFVSRRSLNDQIRRVFDSIDGSV